MDTRHLLVAYSWGTADLGGIAIAPGLLKLIRDVDPGMRVTVLTLPFDEGQRLEWLRNYFPCFLAGCDATVNPFKARLGRPGEPGTPDAAWYAFHERWGQHRLRAFETGSVSARTAAEITDDLLGRFALDLFAQIEREMPTTAHAFSNAGFVIYNSGTVLNFGRGGARNFWDGTLPFAMPLVMAKALGIPYGINNHSFEAIDWPVELIFRKLFDDACFVYCRDTDSLAYLKQKGLLNARSGFRPDSTFFFREFDESWGEAFMAEHGLEDRGFLVMVNRAKIPGRSDESAREAVHAARWKAFVEGWIEETGLPVVICPESRPEIAEDRAFYESLSMSAREKCVCRDAFWTPEQACSLYRRARLVVGHMHTMILALSVETPVLHIQFAEAGRKAWMIDDIGLGDWLIDIDEAEADDLLDAALRIHNEFKPSVARIRTILPRLESLATQVITEVRLGWRAG